MSLREGLITVFRESGVKIEGELQNRSSLIQSGLLDSLALLSLAVWVRKQVGPEVDLASFDLVKEWDTMDDILNFIEKHRSAG